VNGGGDVVGRINFGASSPPRNSSPKKKRRLLVARWIERAERLEALSAKLSAQDETDESADTLLLLADSFRIAAQELESMM